MENRGISLVALIITIIVIIILAVITIFGVNGVIEKAREAKILQEISNEKELVSAAVAQAKKEINNFNEETLGKALGNITGIDETYVFADSDNLAVQFKKSERYYLVNKDGVIEGPVSPIEDEYAGDITKNGKYDGSEDKPYQITCIEDLVAFSIMSNGGNASLGLGSNNFKDKYIVLTRTLDFQSKFSYSDAETMKYGDLNKDTLTEEIKIELTKTEEGCIGFNGINNFNGMFDGQNNQIKNIYMNGTDVVALFKKVNGAEIKNLGVSGNVICSNGRAGGIVAYATSSNKFINLINYCSVTGTTHTGGIVGYFGAGTLVENYIINCVNLGDITGDICAGGIVGYAYSPSGNQVMNVYIYNCCNNGNLINYTSYIIGGIIGTINSDNTGYDNGYIYNCYNAGNVVTNSTYRGGIYGSFRSMVGSIMEIKNSFVLKDLNIKVGQASNLEVNGEKVFEDYINSTMLEKEYMQSQDFVDVLNDYVATYNEEHKSDEDFIELSTWKLSTVTGYPILGNLSE